MLKSSLEKNVNYETYFSDYFGSLYECGNRLKRRILSTILQNEFNTLQKLRILDIGGGTGDIRNDLINYLRARPQFYTLSDISVQTLELAKKLATETNTTPFIGIKADVQQLPFAANVYDLIICSELLEHVKDDKKAVNEIHRVLVPGGHALITVPYLGKPIAKYGHFRHYSTSSFFALFDDEKWVLKERVFIGRLHNLTWVWWKYIFASLWYAWSYISSGRKTKYYTSPFHLHFVMPLVDNFLHLDDLFSRKPFSLIGSRATLVTFFQKRS